MIAVESLFYKIDQRLNKLSTNEHQQIPLEDKRFAINEAQIKLIKNKIDPNNIYKLGFEAFKKRYQDLQILIESFEDHELPLSLGNKQLNKWSVSIKDISPKYMFYIDSYILADKESCKDRVIYINGDLSKHSDVITLLKNTNYKPSFEYQESIVEEASDKISVYTDGTFTPTALFLSYLRYPKNVDYPGIVNFDGSDSGKQDSELEPYLEDELLDIVYMDLGLYTENPSAVQGAQLKTANDE